MLAFTIISMRLDFKLKRTKIALVPRGHEIMRFFFEM